MSAQLEQRVSTTSILQILSQNGLKAERSGPERSVCRFCSVRAPEVEGLYYAVGTTPVPEAVADSVIICDYPRHALTERGNSVIVTHNPQLAFYLLQRHFFAHPPLAGIHPTAIVDSEAIVDPLAFIGPFCLIGRSTVSANCSLYSHVAIYDGVVIDPDVVVEPHSTLGASGVAWAWDLSGTDRVVQPQTGGVRIGSGSFLGSDVTVVRGSINEDTTIGRNCLIAHGTKIGHGCRIGDLVHMANNVSVAGSVTIGTECFLGSGAVVRPHVTLPRGTVVGAGAVVTEAPLEEFTAMAGVPAKVIKSAKQRMSGVPARSGNQT
jgi:UDP-3-O-[3-hydroxymyristoyl] glucosamine N-acyltransferase